MPRPIRRFLLVLYTLFFIAFSVFLLINSFGYRFNTRNRTIENSANITIHTAPFGASVSISGDNKTATTPTELNFAQAGEVNLAISKEGYVSENFRITYTAEKNSTTIIDKLYLLPTKATNTFSYTTGTIKAYLNDTTLLVQKEKQLFIETLGFAGISSSLAVQTEILTPDNTTQQFDFTVIGTDIYWDKNSNTVLLKRANSWSLIGLNKLTPKFQQIIASDGILLGLDSQKQLWSWSYINGSDAQFVDNNISGIAYTASPRTYWLWKNNWIQPITLDNNITGQITPKNARLTNNILLSHSPGTFQIFTVFQGYAIRINDQIWYRPDFSATSLTTIASNVTTFTTTGDTIYWINQENHLSFSNIRSAYRGVIATQLPDTITHIAYHKAWSRVMLFSPTSTYSVWHDNDKINEALKNYSLTRWLDIACANTSESDAVLCGTATEASIYSNRSLLL